MASLREIWHKLTGKKSFRVVYDDDASRTMLLTYDEASSLSRSFGGHVIFDPEKKESKT